MSPSPQVAGAADTGSASGGPAGAAIAPASAQGFFSINTDVTSSQWKNADALSSKFPIRDQLLASVEKTFADNNVDFTADVLPVLGPELDFVLLKDASGTGQLVGMTQPADAQKFDALLEKGATPPKHVVIDGWTVFSDTQAQLTAFQTEAEQGKLARLGDVQAGDGESSRRRERHRLRERCGRGLGSQVGVTSGEHRAQRPARMARRAALSTESDSVRLSARSSRRSCPARCSRQTLLSRVPADSLLVASFRGGDQLSQQLTRTPEMQRQLGQVQQLLGVSIDEITALVAGEGVLYVRPGLIYPEVTLTLKQSDPNAAAATLDKLVTRLSALANASVTTAVIPGVGGAKKVALGPVAVYFGILDDTLVISDSVTGFRARRRRPSPTIPSSRRPRRPPECPPSLAGFVYVNIKDSVPLLEGLAQLGGGTIPPDVTANLAPLESFLAYATVDSGAATFSALLQAR